MAFILHLPNNVTRCTSVFLSVAAYSYCFSCTFITIDSTLFTDILTVYFSPSIFSTTVSSTIVANTLPTAKGFAHCSFCCHLFLTLCYYLTCITISLAATDGTSVLPRGHSIKPSTGTQQDRTPQRSNQPSSCTQQQALRCV